jgi:multiple sugar transport system permease protein
MAARTSGGDPGVRDSAVTVGPARATRRRGRSGRLARGEARAAYIFISPWIVGFLVFTAGPMIASIYFSLTNYDVLQPASWVGLDNYRQILGGDDLFRQALLNTVVYTAMFVPAHMIVALAMALLLNASVRGTPLWRTFFYIPSVTPIVAVAILWRWILNPNGGAINTVLGWFGLPGPGWLTDPSWMKVSLVLLALWQVGSTMLIYVAGLKNIPQDLYEAAKTDGAGALSRFRNVTLPMLSSVLFFTAVIGVISSFQLFAQPAVLFEPAGGSSNGALTGGSGNAALFYIMYLFNQAFAYFKMGYASALAWILFVIIIAFTVLQFRLSNRWVYYEGGDA